MKRKFSLIVCLFMLLSLVATPISAFAAADTTPTDVPKIIIVTENNADPTKSAYVTCSITIIDEEGGTYETIIDEASQIKVRGNSTSLGEKKPFNIKFSSKTDVLGMGKAKKWALLSNCYEKTLMRNKTVLDFAEHTNLEYTSQSKFADLYLNGEYLGSYQITESVEVGSSRVDIDTSINEFLIERDFREDAELYSFTTSGMGIRFAINEPEAADITTAQQSYITTLFANAETALASHNYNNIAKYFDIPTMVDFYIVNEIFKTIDVHISSTRVYVQDGLIHGGPLWDFDLASGNINPEFSAWYTNTNGGNYSGNSWEGIYAGADYSFGLWFNHLMQTPEIKQMVIDRYDELSPYIENLYEDNELGTNYIDSLLAEYGDHFKRNYSEAGWSITETYSSVVEGKAYERIPDATYEENVEYYRAWLKNRHAWLRYNWGLSSSYDPVEPDTPDETVPTPPEGTENLLSGIAIQEYVGGTDWPTYYTDMTDGVINEELDNTASDYTSSWFGFNASQLGSDGRAYVIYDLGKECDISFARIHVALNMYSGDGMGVPGTPQISLSDDGVDFTTTYDIPTGSTTNSSGVAWWTLEGISATARYVKISLVPSHWAFLDEIEVYGTPVEEEGGSDETVTPSFIRGDVDNNGEIKATDYLLLKRILLGVKDIATLDTPETAQDRCDVNKDGSVKSTDYLMLKRYLLGVYEIVQ